MAFDLLGMRYIGDRKEYLEFIDYIRTQYYNGDTVMVDDVFGLNLEYDEETGYYTKTVLEHDGDIKVCPDTFPVIMYYKFDETEDRCGKMTFQEVFWKTPEQLGIKAKRTNLYRIAKCRWKLPMYEPWMRRGCKSCDGLCIDCGEYWKEGDTPPLYNIWR